MKKLLVTAVLGLKILSADATDTAREKSGIFIGAGVGTTVNYYSYKSERPTLSLSETKISSEYNVGLRVGLSYYFNSYNGVRGYGHFNYGNMKFADFNLPLYRYGANIDYLLNFSNNPSTWGLFIGVGYEFLGGKFSDHLKEVKKNNTDPDIKVKINTNGIFMNIGFSKIIQNHHRIEFGGKIPFYVYEDFHVDDPLVQEIARTAVTLYIAYSYSF